MLKLREISIILSGVPVLGVAKGSALFVRLSDMSDLKTGRVPKLAAGEVPAVARASRIEKGDLIVAARGAVTDACVAQDLLLGAFVSLDLYLVRPDRSRVEPEYLAAFFIRVFIAYLFIVFPSIQLMRCQIKTHMLIYSAFAIAHQPSTQSQNTPAILLCMLA